MLTEQIFYRFRMVSRVKRPIDVTLKVRLEFGRWREEGKTYSQQLPSTRQALTEKHTSRQLNKP